MNSFIKMFQCFNCLHTYINLFLSASRNCQDIATAQSIRRLWLVLTEARVMSDDDLALACLRLRRLTRRVGGTTSYISVSRSLWPREATYWCCTALVRMKARLSLSSVSGSGEEAGELERSGSLREARDTERPGPGAGGSSTRGMWWLEENRERRWVVTRDLRDILLAISSVPDSCRMPELILAPVTQLRDLLVSAPALVTSFTLGALRPDNTDNDGHYHTGKWTTYTLLISLTWRVVLFFLMLFVVNVISDWTRHQASLNSFFFVFFITTFRSDRHSLIEVLSDFTVDQLKKLCVRNVPVTQDVVSPAVISRGLALTPDRPRPNSGAVWAKRMNPWVTVCPPPPQACKIFVNQHSFSALKSRFHKELIKFKENWHILVSSIFILPPQSTFPCYSRAWQNPTERHEPGLLCFGSSLLSPSTGIWSCNNQQRDNR